MRRSYITTTQMSFASHGIFHWLCLSLGFHNSTITLRNCTLPETVGFPQAHFLLLGGSCADLRIMWVPKTGNLSNPKFETQLQVYSVPWEPR